MLGRSAVQANDLGSSLEHRDPATERIEVLRCLNWFVQADVARER
jgi:hypothetical protein